MFCILLDTELFCPQVDLPFSGWPSSSIRHHPHLRSALMIHWRPGAAAGQRSFIRSVRMGKKPLFYQPSHEYLWLHMGEKNKKVYSKLFQPCFQTKYCSAWLVKAMSVTVTHWRSSQSWHFFWHAVSKEQHGISLLHAEYNLCTNQVRGCNQVQL